MKLLHYLPFALLFSSFFATKLTDAAMSPEEIRAGLESYDRALHVKDGWMRDPYITLGPDGYYYLTGTTAEPNDPREKTEPYNTGLDGAINSPQTTPSIVGGSVRAWRSKDLVEWEYLGVIFTMDQGYWAEVEPEAFEKPVSEWRLWAPEVHYLKDHWIIVHTSPAPVRRGANLAISKGEGFAGPYEHPMKELMLGKHDPSLYEDVDGTIYLLWGNTWIAPLKPGFSGFAKEPVRIDPSDRVIGHEGATMQKIGDKYVHFGTAWSTDKLREGTYNLYYCTSENIMGPYGPRKFAGRFLGHGTPFQDKQGRWWCTAFFNGNFPTIPREDANKPFVADNAYSINEQGVTIVPLDVRVLDDGEIYIRAIDPDYAKPGPEEATKYN